jgi:hypothetical protein
MVLDNKGHVHVVILAADQSRCLVLQAYEVRVGCKRTDWSNTMSLVYMFAKAVHAMPVQLADPVIVA